MSIIDLVNLNNIIMGITRDGYLIGWNINAQQLAQEKINKDYPFIASDFQYKLTQHTALSMTKNQNYIFVCTDKQVKIVRIADLQNFIKKNKNKYSKAQLLCKTIHDQHGIQTAIILRQPTQQSSQIIDQAKQNQLSMNNSSNINQSQNASIIYTTKTGRIISLSSDFNKTTTMCDLKSFQFNHNLGQNEVATSLIAFRQGKLLLVGTSSGRILIVNISFQRIVQDIVKKNNLKLPGIRTLVLSSGGHKFYSLHENSVYEWSIQLQKCLGYYSYNCPYSVLYTQRLSFNSPKILISGPNRFIEVIDAQNPKLISQVQSNLESIQVMKQKDGKIFCGGKYGMIQIIEHGISSYLLFKSQPNAFI